MNTPYVSIIVPSFNRDHTLLTALNSAVDQTIHDTQDIEIIVVDDASTDVTQRLLSFYQRVNPCVKLIRHNKRQGVSGARNTGIKNATGEYIAFLDSDDVWDPEKLLKQIERLEAMRERGGRIPDVLSMTYFANVERQPDPISDEEIIQQTLDLPSTAYSISEIFVQGDKNGVISEENKNLKYKTYTEDQIIEGIISRELWFGVGSTLVAHRKTIEANGFFKLGMGCAEDTEYVIRHLARRGKVDVVPEVLMTYTMPEDGKIYDKYKSSYVSLVQDHKCTIAETFGPDMAAAFVRNVGQEYDEHRNSVGDQLRRTRAELTIPATAPCRDITYHCHLKGRVCGTQYDFL